MPTLQDARAADGGALGDNWSNNNEQCDFQTATVNKQPRESPSFVTTGNMLRVLFNGPARLFILSAVMGAPVIAVVMYAYFRPSVLNQWAAQNKQLVNEWLDALHNGESGNGFWGQESFVKPVKLFSVSSWEIVRYDSSCVWVRVDSSNGAGMPIRKLWKIEFMDSLVSSRPYAPKIMVVSDADNAKQ